MVVIFGTYHPKFLQVSASRLNELGEFVKTKFSKSSGLLYFFKIKY